MVCLVWMGYCYNLYSTTNYAPLKSNLYSLTVFTVVYWLIISYYPIAILFKNARPINDYGNEMIGNYTADEVKEIVNEVLATSNRREKPTVFILNSEVCIAFAMNIYLLDFIKRYNSISISREFFNHLTRNEIKAVLLHELGHFNGFIYSETKAVGLAHLFFMVLPM